MIVFLKSRKCDDNQYQWNQSEGEFCCAEEAVAVVSIRQKWLVIICKDNPGKFNIEKQLPDSQHIEESANRTGNTEFAFSYLSWKNV